MAVMHVPGSDALMASKVGKSRPTTFLRDMPRTSTSQLMHAKDKQIMIDQVSHAEKNEDVRQLVTLVLLTSTVLIMMTMSIFYWQVLVSKPARTNEYLKLELPRPE